MLLPCFRLLEQTLHRSQAPVARAASTCLLFNFYLFHLCAGSEFGEPSGLTVKSSECEVQIVAAGGGGRKKKQKCGESLLLKLAETEML